MKKFLLLIFILIFSTAPANATEPHEGYVFVPREFELFTESTFMSDRVGRFPAQTMEIIVRGADNWAYVRESFGERTGWLNLRYTPALCILDEFFAPLGRNVAVFFKNMDTGFTYIHNPDRVFFAASLSKSNHALYTFQLAERGLINMYTVHTYTGADAWGGTGVLQWGQFGRELTTRDLLAYSMRESDNAAFRMLVRYTQNASLSYRDFVTEIGANPRFILNPTSQNTSAPDAGLFMTEIFHYIENPSRYGHYLRYDMLNTAQTSHPHFTRWEGSNGWGDNGIGTDVNIRMIRSDYPLARKYGWSGGAFHDAGIIYAPSPYILVILSNMERGAHDLFEEISWFVQDFNRRTFVSPAPLDSPRKGPSFYDGGSVRVAGRRGGFRVAAPVFAELYGGIITAQIIEFYEKTDILDRKRLFKNILS